MKTNLWREVYDEEVPLEWVRQLCVDFSVDFKIETYQYGDKQSFPGIVYCFGPVKWDISARSRFTFEYYIGVTKRLAATFPEKVLGG